MARIRKPIAGEASPSSLAAERAMPSLKVFKRDRDPLPIVSGSTLDHFARSIPH